MDRSRRVGRGVEIVAQRRAQRRLVALLDGDRLDHWRPKVARRRRQQLVQGARLGLEPLRLALGFGVGLPRGRLGVAGGGVGLLAGEQAFLGLLGGGARVLERLEGGFEILPAACFLELGQFVVDLLKFGGEAVVLLNFVPQGAFERAAARVHVGEGRLGLRQLLLGFGERALGVGQGRLGLELGFRRILALRLQLLVLGAQLLDHARRVVDQRGLAGEVADKLGHAAFELRRALLGALLLAFELVAREHEPLQGGAGAALRLAQSRKGVGGEGLQAGRFSLLARPFHDLHGLGFEPRFGRGHLVGHGRVADEEHQRLVPADFGGDVLVAARLPRLPAQAVGL